LFAELIERFAKVLQFLFEAAALGDVIHFVPQFGYFGVDVFGLLPRFRVGDTREMECQLQSITQKSDQFLIRLPT
jgi:hypothetical protein